MSNWNGYRRLSLASHAGRALPKDVTNRPLEYYGGNGIRPEEQREFPRRKPDVHMPRRTSAPVASVTASNTAAYVVRPPPGGPRLGQPRAAAGGQSPGRRAGRDHRIYSPIPRRHADRGRNEQREPIGLAQRQRGTSAVMNASRRRWRICVEVTRRTSEDDGGQCRSGGKFGVTASKKNEGTQEVARYSASASRRSQCLKLFWGRMLEKASRCLQED